MNYKLKSFQNSFKHGIKSKLYTENYQILPFHSFGYVVCEHWLIIFGGVFGSSPVSRLSRVSRVSGVSRMSGVSRSRKSKKTSIESISAIQDSIIVDGILCFNFENLRWSESKIV